ncbi:MAG: ParB N-terminal domain-containing protein [Peptococcaceae bacterium]|jgi:ParB family chromosome partitioning protein|nr:ParB N-terminal domain-containing protein [Peptococcaceae bacterium]
MEVREIPLNLLHEARWNANEMTESTLTRLANSLGKFDTVLPLVVRPIEESFEVIGGNQRLTIHRSQGMQSAPCVVVNLDDVQARLLAQALNRVHGEDDINRKDALVKQILSELPEEDVLAILPETADYLRALASLGQQTAESLAVALSAWEKAKSVRLERISFPFTDEQKRVVEEAVEEATFQIEDDGPNKRGAALALICREWLEGDEV